VCEVLVEEGKQENPALSIFSSTLFLQDSSSVSLKH
jgi:hypothetical protein